MIKKSTRTIILSIIFLAALTFAILAVFVAQGSTLTFDQTVLRWINSFSSPVLDSFFVAFTQLGGVIVVAAVAIALFVFFLYKKLYSKALLIALGIGGVALMNLILKTIFERARPDLWTWIVAESNFSFPSGHSSASAALALCVIVLLWNTKWRRAALIGGGVYIVLIGLSRLYLGVHYPTDILGGWLLGAVWVGLMTLCIYSGIARLQKKEIA